MGYPHDTQTPRPRGAGMRTPRPPSPAARIVRCAQAYGEAVREAVDETIWPTRCAVCDEPGEVLCAACAAQLPYLDWWRACPRCGAPTGRVQCTECNEVMMELIGRQRPPFDGCASVALFEADNATARIVRTWKDGGERRLGPVMAGLMVRCVPPAWRALNPVVVPVPASTRALRRRGFDHIDELARELAGELALPCAQLLARPQTHDQRALSKEDRLKNLEGRLRVLPGADAPARALVVDDVLTTGATLYAATDALRAAGAQQVLCLTFARVW